MSFLPPELSSLASIFRITLTAENTVASFEELARLHGYALAVLQRVRGGWVEQCLLQEEAFIKGYAPEGGTAPVNDRNRIQAFLDQVRSTPGLLYEPVLNPSGRVQLATAEKTLDMFPFAEALHGSDESISINSRAGRAAMMASAITRKASPVCTGM